MAQAVTRLDVALVARGLARSRTHAQQLIGEQRVRVGGVEARKASAIVSEADELTVAAGDEWVSRAAYKLLGALDALNWDSVPPRVLDAGASTGGFTQVLLSRGAQVVYAVDVGHDQLAEPVRRDPRVQVRERLNLRDLTVADLDGEPVDLVVADVSFISLRLLLPQLFSALTRNGKALLMVKPQFEVGRERLGAGGVVRNQADRDHAVAAVVDAAADVGWDALWQQPSVLPGPSGNVEYFVLFAPRHPVP